MNKRMSIEELADEANKIIAQNPSIISDKRVSDTISVRRIRDYISKEMMDKPYKDGRNTYYVQLHLDQLLTLRELQNDGLSESYIQKLSSSSSLVDTVRELSSGRQELQNIDYSSIQASSSLNSLSADESLQKNALSLLSGMKGNLAVGSASIESSRLSTNSRTFVSGYLGGQSSPKYNLDNKVLAVSKTWVEYPLDTEGKLFLKMESGAKVNNPEQVLQQLKAILNIQ